MADPEIELADIARAIATRSPELGTLVVDYTHQEDPPPGISSADPTAPAQRPPADAWTMERLRATLRKENMVGKGDDERKALRRQAWNALLASPWAPERLQLGDLLIGLYEEPQAWSRTALLEIVKKARLKWGVFKAIKAIYKLAEQRHDAELFGALAYRLDTAAMWGADVDRAEIGGATTSYLRRRAWRYLRQLGQSVPELYPEMAAQVLRHFPRDAPMRQTWVANQIFGHHQLIGMTSAWVGQLPKLEHRAFDDAWKLSPEPLLRLLEDAENDWVCEFAILSLKRDFEEALRGADVPWMIRIGKKPLTATQKLVVELLTANPEFHQSKLRELGLADTIIGFLRTESDTVAAYAVGYVKAHVPDLDPDAMIELVEGDVPKKVSDLVVARLSDVAAERLGLPRLFRMLGVSALAALAKKKVHEGYAPSDIDETTFVEGYLRPEVKDLLVGLYAKTKVAIPTDYLAKVALHPELDRWRAREVLEKLGKRPGAEIGMDWFKRALFETATANSAAMWLRQGKLRGKELDLSWLKELTKRPTQRGLALDILGNEEVVPPSDLGVGWLLSLLKRVDPSLGAFARRRLLTHFGPAEFAEGGSLEEDVQRLWELAGPRDERRRKRPEVLRTFVFDWLRMHHPEIGPTLAEARELGVSPKLAVEAYTFERVQPLLSDDSADARRFAADIARQEMARWNDPDVAYALATSPHVEVRGIGTEALLAIGEKSGELSLPAEWLDGTRIFGLAESATKATRELALTLIRKHYERIGGKAKLAWLMESPEREVRLFAVRLLWERHRPRPAPRPIERGVGKERRAPDRFESLDELRHFLRAVLFGLPPGRMERREGSAVDRPMKSGEAKRRLIELARDMGDDRDFASVVVPILEETMHSEALGEWQASVAALARLRRMHPELAVDLPDGALAQRPARERRGFA